MYSGTLGFVNIATLLVLSSTLYLQTSPSPEQEIITDVLCWGLILVCGVVYFNLFSDVSQSSRPRSTNSTDLNTAALCAALLCLSSSVRVVNWSLAPILSPIVFVIQSLRVTNTVLPKLEEPQPRFHNVNKRTAIFLGILAATAIFVLAKDRLFDSFNLQLCWLLSQVGLFIVLHRGASESESANPDDIYQILRTATEIAPRILAITGPATILWWRGVPSVLDAGVTVILKAVWWMAVLTLASESKLSVIPLATTFAVCTNAIGLYVEGSNCVLVGLAAIAALYQITVVVSQHRMVRLVILAFTIFPFRALLIEEQSALRFMSLHYGFQHHPIYHLAEEAAATFEEMQIRQSRSLIGAVSEYKRRYGRQPPQGFHKWYDFMLANNISFVDEYDFMTHSVDPYWHVTPNILRDYIELAASMTPSSSRLGVLEIKDHKAEVHNGNFQHDQLLQLLQPVLEFLPDMKMILNDLDESRVIVPHDVLSLTETSRSSETTELAGSDYKTRLISFTDLGHQKSFDSIVLSCPPDSPARSPIARADHGKANIPFISNITEARDICHYPAWKADQHGILSSPSTLVFTHQRLPIASTAKVSSFQDILIPSSYYFQDDIAEYNESWDPSWEEKEDIVYWRGSGTGGQWHDGSWRHGHRQRFVNFTNSPAQKIQLMNQTGFGGQWTTYNSTIGEMDHLFKTNFSKFFQCDARDCSEQKAKFLVAPTDTLEDSYKYKILYNLDGNSFSGRYYRFLKSNSLVFMQNLFREWHEDRLIPWVHYVPISLGMEELPETARYLLEDPEGQKIAARIARDSREWARKILRPIDLSAALLRILLEYNQLLQDDRGDVGCCG